MRSNFQLYKTEITDIFKVCQVTWFFFLPKVLYPYWMPCNHQWLTLRIHFHCHTSKEGKSPKLCYLTCTFRSPTWQLTTSPGLIRYRWHLLTIMPNRPVSKISIFAELSTTGRAVVGRDIKWNAASQSPFSLAVEVVSCSKNYLY